jgi:uncharacterized protein YjbI with pentapeptide repeats
MWLLIIWVLRYGVAFIDHLNLWASVFVPICRLGSAQVLTIRLFKEGKVFEAAQDVYHVISTNGQSRAPGNPQVRIHGVEWNGWRAKNPNVVPDLSRAHFREGRFSCSNLAGADLTLAYFGRADLAGTDLSSANLSEASLRGANFAKANLTNATLIGTDVTRADFSGAQLVSANISRAYLERANLAGANLENATLTGSDLRLATAVDTNFRGADLTGCMIYGIAAWNTDLAGARQQDLVITKSDEHTS